MELELLAIGEAMAELRKSNDDVFSVGFAGDTFNTALYCSRELSCNGKVGFMSRVGLDPLSNSFLELAQGEGLDVAQVSRDQETNIGIYSVSTDHSGERSFHYWRNSSAARKMFLVDEAVRFIPRANITYLSGITLAILHPVARLRLMDHLKQISDAGKSLIAFDSNYRPALWENKESAQQVIAHMWEIADIALPSIDDEMDLFDEKSEDTIIARFSERTWKACAIKRGVRGPISPMMKDEAKLAFQPAEKVIDTTAAGDSFNGAYLASFLLGKDETECLLAGHSCASRVVGFQGAIVPAELY